MQFASVPPAQALRELYRSGLDGQYDLSIIQQLIQFLGVYPIGSLVELTSGEQAVVVWVHPHARLQPSIKLISDPRESPMKSKKLLIYLCQERGRPNAQLPGPWIRIKKTSTLRKF